MEQNPDRQHTLAGQVKLSGVGLDTGVPVTLGLTPAAANTGIIVKRTDLEEFAIKASAAR
ncbi:MAG: UDP-3-O-acyl-N-acetylglucosamine deacetylase, partial [Terriglobia bacterium]